MTFDRLNPGPILRAHAKGLTRGDRPTPVADGGAVAALAVAFLLWIPALVFAWRLAAPDALLAGVSLLAGALLSAFGIIATVRIRLQDRDPHSGPGTQRAKDLLDEAVSHLLTATLGCLVDAVLLVIGSNVRPKGETAMTGILAAAAISVSAYIAVAFLMLLTRLYSAYVDAVQPRDELNGLVTGSRRR